MLTTPIIKTCKKCGERSEHVATLPHGGGYEIYQCLNCKSVEWVPLRSVERGPMRNAERQKKAIPNVSADNITFVSTFTTSSGFMCASGP